MSKIDTNLAVQIADMVRPVQVSQERAQQTQQALLPQIQDGSAAGVSANDARVAAARLKQVVESASGSKLRFELDEESGSLFAIITDRVTGEEIRRIPSQEAARLHERLVKGQGLLLDRLA